MSKETDIIGDAMSEIYSDVHAENQEYINSLQGHKEDTGGAYAPRSQITTGEDLGRITVGSGATADDTAEDIYTMPNKSKRGFSVLTEDSDDFEEQGDPQDEQAPEQVDEIVETGDYNEDYTGNPDADIKVDNPTTTKGKVVLVMYATIMLGVAVYGINFIINQFKSTPPNERNIDLVGAVDKLRSGVDEDAMKEIDDILFSTKDSQNDKIGTESVVPPSAEVSGEQAEGAHAKGMDTTVGESAGVTDQPYVISDDTKQVATVEELKSAPLDKCTYYSPGSIRYRDSTNGVIDYMGQDPYVMVVGQEFKAIQYVRYDADGILLKSPLSRKYVYIVPSAEQILSVKAEGLVDMRVYWSDKYGEVYVDILDFKVVSDKEGNVTSNPVKSENAQRETTTKKIDGSIEEEIKEEFSAVESLFGK